MASTIGGTAGVNGDTIGYIILAVLAVLLVFLWYPIMFWSYIVFIFSAIALSDVIMTISFPLLFINRNIFRKLTNSISHFGWPLITFAFEKLGKNKLVFTGDDISVLQKGVNNNDDNATDRNALVLINHTYHCDWLLAFSLGERVGRIGNIKIAMKNVIKYIPFVGVGIWAMGFIFLSRKWQSDQRKINLAYSHLKSDGEPFWFVTHPEGSRVDAKRLKESQEFARERQSQGVPILNNILVPRVKGFVSAVLAMHDTVDAIYDLTVAYKKRPASFFSLFYGNQPTEIHIHIRRYSISSLPLPPTSSSSSSSSSSSTDMSTYENEIGKWLYDRYREKDALVQEFKEKGYFTGKSLSHLNKFNASKYSLNLIVWIALVILFIYLSNLIYNLFF